jgi:DNA processing protein
MEQDLAKARKAKRADESRYQPPAKVAVVGLHELVPPHRRILPASPGQLQLGGIFEAQEAWSRLWCAGDLKTLQNAAVAVVGARRVSQYGAARARKVAKGLAGAGIVVVSGLAEGVDAEAHQAAIAAGGSTVAVIGTPLDTAYPAANKRLQESIYKNHLLVSPFEPGARVFPGNFPRRNKLMAAVTDATIIVEATDQSGTLHQAAECRRLGRWLFVMKSVMDDKRVTWPARFGDYARFRVLEDLSDVLPLLATKAVQCSSK